MRTIDLTVRYGAKEAVQGASLDVLDKDVLALIGPSGCGKSTFLRCLNRMNDAIDGAVVDGKVLLEGEDIYGRHVDPVLVRRLIGMVFQQPNPFPTSIYENVAYGLRIAGAEPGRMRDTVERALHDAALWAEVKDRLHEPALGLSGGQQQRLCIARALAADPKVLLLDEPASALDPNATAHIEDLISTLRRSRAIVIVTHNMEQAARVSQHTAFFYMGRLVEVGETQTVFKHPKMRETEAYVTGRFG